MILQNSFHLMILTKLLDGLDKNLHYSISVCVIQLLILSSKDLTMRITNSGLDQVYHQFN